VVLDSSMQRTWSCGGFCRQREDQCLHISTVSLTLHRMSVTGRREGEEERGWGGGDLTGIEPLDRHSGDGLGRGGGGTCRRKLSNFEGGASFAERDMGA